MSSDRGFYSKELFLKGLQKFSKFPADHLWMLVVDGRLYAKENGPQLFEKREEGSVVGVLSALSRALLKMPQGLSLELFLELHELCLKPISNKSSLMEPGKLRSHSSTVPIAQYCSSLAGVRSIYDLETAFSGYSNGTNQSYIGGWALVAPEELVIDQASGKPAGKYCIEDLDNPVFASDKRTAVKSHFKKIEAAVEKQWSLFFTPPNPCAETEPEVFEFFLKSMIKHLLVETVTNSLNKASNDNERIEAIAQFGQDALRLHPFADGNNRNFVNCVMNVLFIMNGLLPCIYEQPNIFECISVPELVDYIKKGQALTQQVMDSPNSKVLGYSNASLPKELAQKFTKESNSVMMIAKAQLSKLAAGEEKTQAKESPLLSQSLFTEPKAEVTPHEELRTKLEKLGAQLPTQKSVLEAVQQKEYALALRRACAHKLDKPALLILEYHERFKFDLNERSSNHFTALDWVEKNYSANMAAVKEELLKLGLKALTLSS